MMETTKLKTMNSKAIEAWKFVERTVQGSVLVIIPKVKIEKTIVRKFVVFAFIEPNITNSSYKFDT